jgi:signal recognition particle GTPase
MLDRISRGGSIVEVRQTMPQPANCVGVGKQMDELELFDSVEFVGNLFEE